MNSLTFVPITFGLVSVVFLAVAMGTDYWLFTVEPIRRQNITSAYGEIIETETSEKFQHLGLWRVCTYHDQVHEYVCRNNIYVQKKGKQKMDSTETIILFILRATVAFSLSSMILIFAIIWNIVHVAKRRKSKCSAMIYIYSALVLGVGVIIFVSSVDDVMLNRRNRERVLHSTTEYRELVFHCWYGWSVFMLPLSFMSAIIAATINVKV